MFERQWVNDSAAMPEFHDLDAFRDFSAEPDIRDHAPNKAITEWLDLMEDLATGVNLEVYDIKVVHRLIGTRVLRGWRNLRPWIEARRLAKQQPTLYCEFETLAREMYATRTEPFPKDVIGTPEFELP